MPELLTARRHILRPTAGLVVVLAASVAFAQGAEVLEDDWYVLKLDDVRSGWMHSTLTRDGDSLRTEIDTEITVRRGMAQISLHVKEAFVETTEGTPIEATLTHRFGFVDVQRRLRFDGPEIVIEHRQGAQTRRETHRNEQAWLPPAAAQRRIRQALANGADRITYHTLQPALGAQVVEVNIEVTGKEAVEIYGKVVPATAWEIVTTAMPDIAAHEFVDDRGRLLKSSMQVAGTAFTVLRAEEALAMSPVQAPEMMAATLVEVNGPVAASHRLTRAAYRVHIDGAAAGTHDRSRPVETSAQRVTWLDDRTANITVDLTHVNDRPHDTPTDDHRLPSAMIDSDAPSVTALLDVIVSPEDRRAMPRAALAETARRFVQQHVTQKNLAVGFATASETARSGQGDCTEHAVLLAALLRAAEIPGRTVTGLVYADRFLDRDHVFVYHMWTQAWIEDAAGRGRWLDLDATRPHAPFDAAHIALSTSALSDEGFYNDLMLVTPFIGTLTLDVVATGDAVETSD